MNNNFLLSLSHWLKIDTQDNDGKMPMKIKMPEIMDNLISEDDVGRNKLEIHSLFNIQMKIRYSDIILQTQFQVLNITNY